MTQHLEILVEEFSMERALEFLLPKLVPDLSYAIRTFGGKSDLLAKLPSRLQGYRSWVGPSDAVIAVVVDRDASDCRDVLAELDAAAVAAGFTPAVRQAGRRGDLLNRIVCEELEAWFFGDPLAVCTAYPKVNKQFASKAAYRDPDDIRGGTWEALERVLQRSGYFEGGLAKATAAAEIASFMDTERNVSPSFVSFRDGLRFLVNGAV